MHVKAPEMSVAISNHAEQKRQQPQLESMLLKGAVWSCACTRVWTPNVPQVTLETILVRKFLADADADVFLNAKTTYRHSEGAAEAESVICFMYGRLTRSIFV